MARAPHGHNGCIIRGVYRDPSNPRTLLQRFAGSEERVSHHGMHWEEALSSAGHRITPQRSIVLDAVCSGGGHTTIGEIYAYARKRDRTIDRSTIYRALHLFTAMGIVLPADTGEGETSYEIRKPEPHHHLVCRQCGGQQEISGPTAQSMFDVVERLYTFQVNTDHLVLFGICAHCQPEAVSPENGVF